MERLQAYKFELRPDGAQRRLMRQFAGSCRYVYNRALALQKTRYGRGEKKLGYAGLCKELTAWRNEAMWLAAAHSQILQQALKDLEHAYRNFFEKRAAFPRFKKKGQRDSFRFPQGTQLEQSHDRIYLPKLGWMRYRNSRAVPGEVRNATVSLSAGRWFVSIQTRQQDAPTVNPARTAIGIDMGVARFAMLSDGAVYEPLDSFKRHQRRLAHYQRMMSRRSKFGKNWQNARRKVQKVHARIGNCRRDYLHKATTTISKNHAMVCIEDLQERSGQIGAESLDPRSGVVRVPPPASIQAGVERRHAHRGAATQHQPRVSGMRAHGGGKPYDPGAIPLRRVRVLRARRPGRGNQCFGAGTPRGSLWRHFARSRGVGPGTRRSESV